MTQGCYVKCLYHPTPELISLIPALAAVAGGEEYVYGGVTIKQGPLDFRHVGSFCNNLTEVCGLQGSCSVYQLAGSATAYDFWGGWWPAAAQEKPDSVGCRKRLIYVCPGL